MSILTRSSRVSRAARAGILALGLAAMPWAHAADAYPSKPVRVIVPFPPGAGVDIVTRLVAARLTVSMGQQFIIENKPGAAGNLGAEYVARATPDGYTLLAAASSITASSSLYSHLAFDLKRDFAPVAMMASAPFLLVVNPAVPVKSVQELISYAKANPGKLTFASTGNGSSPHLTMEVFKRQAGVDMLHVPYKGSGPALTDLVSGQVNVMFANILSVLPQVKSGRLRALAVSSARRSTAAPEYPTVAEAGLKGFQSETWFAILAPAGTPEAVIAKLNTEVAKAAASPEVREQLKLQGAEPGSGSPADLRAYINEEVDKWSAAVKAAGVKIE
jgi:tripartite-type tricarboxylate transporter receptor subunit TctC